MRFKQLWPMAVTALIGMSVLSVIPIRQATAATGDLVGSVTFSSPCSGEFVNGFELGVGIAFDGSNLWYSCYGSTTDLYRADPTTGIVTAFYDIIADGGLGALSYDATRNAIWAGEGYGGPAGEQVYRIDLDGGKNVAGTSPVFNAADPGFCDVDVDDGLAFDANNVADPSDDAIYYSNDCSTTTIRKYDLSGSLLESFVWGGAACYNSGLAIGGELLYEGSDGCSHVWVVDKATKAAAFDFSTVVAGDPNFRDEDLECDTVTFASLGKHVMWSKEAYGPMRAHAFEIEFGTCGFGGVPPGGIEVEKFFTDSSLNPLPLDQFGNPMVDVVLASGVVRSTNPGQVIVWIRVTSTSPVLSLVVNETLPVDWTVHPPWDPAMGAIHVYFEFADGTRVEITDASSTSASTGIPETVGVSIPDLSATVAGGALDPGESVLVAVKIDYALAGTSQSPGTYPRNYTDTASISGWPEPNYMGSPSTDTVTGFFIAYAKVVGDADGDMDVDVDDVVEVWLFQFTGSGRHDMDFDGDVDLEDLNITWQFQFT